MSENGNKKSKCLIGAIQNSDSLPWIPTWSWCLCVPANTMPPTLSTKTSDEQTLQPLSKKIRLPLDVSWFQQIWGKSVVRSKYQNQSQIMFFFLSHESNSSALASCPKVHHFSTHTNHISSLSWIRLTYINKRTHMKAIFHIQWISFSKAGTVDDPLLYTLSKSSNNY